MNFVNMLVVCVIAALLVAQAFAGAVDADFDGKYDAIVGDYDVIIIITIS